MEYGFRYLEEAITVKSNEQADLSQQLKKIQADGAPKEEMLPMRQALMRNRLGWDGLRHLNKVRAEQYREMEKLNLVVTSWQFA